MIFLFPELGSFPDSLGIAGKNVTYQKLALRLIKERRRHVPGTGISDVKVAGTGSGKAPQVPVLLCVYYTPSLKDVQNSLGSALNGTIYLDYPDTAGSSAEFNAFLAEFEKQTGVTVRAPFNFRTNYNAVKVIYDGIVNVGADPVKVKDYLYSYDHPSATGRLRFDSNGDVVDLDLVLRTFESK